MSDPLFDRPPTARPYRGTGGSSGSAPSSERAAREIADGTLGRRQARILTLLAEAGTVGMTVRELCAQPDLGHHGQVSGALSNLHHEGHIAALKEEWDGGRRGGAGVYVLPEHVASRATRAYRPNKGNRAYAVVADEVRAHADQERPPKPVLTGKENALVSRVLQARGGHRSPVITLKTETFDDLMLLIRRLADV